MSTRNRFGLSRHIPENIALEVRRKSRFGCVICRSAVYQYEHIDPEFSESKEHSSEQICLLCGGCHDRVTRGRVSKETVAKHYKKTQRRDGNDPASEELDFAGGSLTVEIGPVSFVAPTSILQINGENILSLTPPEVGSSIPRLTGVFYDVNGNESFRIVDNIWEGPLEAWDIETVGRKTTIKLQSGKVALSFEVKPPRSIIFHEIDMLKDNCRLISRDDSLIIGQTIDGVEAFVELGKFICMMPKVGVSVDSRNKILTETPRD